MIESIIHFMSADLGTDFKFNDRNDLINLGQPTHQYFIALTSADGLRGADVDREEWPVPGQEGVVSGDTFRRGKTITFTGRIEAASYGALQLAKRYMEQMFADTAKRQLRYQLWGEPQIYYKMRVVNDLAIVEQISDLRYNAGYVVGLRADDPRSYKVSDNTLYPTWQG
jgi:hypothetical protein